MKLRISRKSMDDTTRFTYYNVTNKRINIELGVIISGKILEGKELDAGLK